MLSKAKPDYVIYWHYLVSMKNPFEEGYIGIAKVTKYGDRWKNGLYKSYAGCAHFQKAIIKYGEENIETIILHEGLSMKQAICLEKNYRPLCNIGWNIKQGGGNYGLLSQETKEKISKTKKTQEYQYDKIFTKETREKIRLSKIGNKNRLGLHNSEEMKKKQSESAKKRGVSKHFRESTYKKVICLETNVIYNSQMEAENDTGINHRQISAVCNGYHKKAGGYTWRIVNE